MRQTWSSLTLLSSFWKGLFLYFWFTTDDWCLLWHCTIFTPGFWMVEGPKTPSSCRTGSLTRWPIFLPVWSRDLAWAVALERLSVVSFCCRCGVRLMWGQLRCWQKVAPSYSHLIILSHHVLVEDHFKEDLLQPGKSSPTYYYYYTHPGRLSLGDLLRSKPWQFIIDQIDSFWFLTPCAFTASHSGSWRWSSWGRRWTSTSSTTLSTCRPTSTRSSSSSRATAYLSSRCLVKEKMIRLNGMDWIMDISGWCEVYSTLWC